MRLHRIRLRPTSAWRTPWRADTLAGMLYGAIAHRHGGDTLRERVTGPALDGRPPFVVSDAFPGDFLPLPAALKTLDWSLDLRKKVKKARWLPLPAFRDAQRGTRPGPATLDGASPIREAVQLHNTLARDGTAAGAGGLYPREEYHLEEKVEHFTIYARFAETDRELLEAALGDLAATGYGADRSAGKGQFDIVDGFASAPELEDVPAANGVVSLSTFQPAAGDPTDGAWAAFTKYGKLGPEFGLGNVFKRPLVMLEPGATFRTTSPRPYFGRAMSMADFLPAATVEELHGRGVEVVHPAFALAVPFRFAETQ